MTHHPKNSVAVPPVEVTYIDPETGDTLAVQVQSTIKDRSAYEIYAHKHGWPTDRPMTTATFLWSGFIAWSAIRRQADAPAILKTSNPDDFFDVILDVIPVVEDDPDEMPHVHPTDAAPGSEHV